uniref:Uncharacterized protein n=1 Tax=Avena sativa TaxID=4498 RepID=A0ACD5WHD1_AVESA
MGVKKIRIFAWRLATNSLAVTDLLHQRIQKINPCCSVCGTENEDSHHAVIRCTIARALREGLRTVWSLPAESTFWSSGHDWFLQLLSSSSEDMRIKILFMFWRTWYHRNNIVHGDGKASLAASVPFLQNYVDTLRALPRISLDAKGKTPIVDLTPSPVLDDVLDSDWKPPNNGCAKINVDAGWDERTKVAGLGVVARDQAGVVLLSAWKHVSSCTSAEEAEILAMLEGLRLAALHIDKPTVFETDCARVAEVLGSHMEDRSANWCLYKEAHDRMIELPDSYINKVGRIGNKVAHELAQLGKRELSGVLLGYAPSCVSVLIERDCMNTII